MGLCLHWASRSGKQASNNPLVKGTLLLLFSKLKLTLIVKVNGLQSKTVVVALLLSQISQFKQAGRFERLWKVVKVTARLQKQSYKCVT